MREADQPPTPPSPLDAGQHPALATTTGPGHLSGLTLILPHGLGKDDVLAGLIRAIGEARATLEDRATLFWRRTEEYAASGQQPSQALCRGQHLASWAAISVIDEAITGASGLWPHYETAGQPPGPAAITQARTSPQAQAPRFSPSTRTRADR